VLTADPAYKNRAFCFFADVYLNIGQTFSDVKTLENTNLAAALNLGARIHRTNWKISVQTVATERSTTM
jgi:hypothetical protein